MVDSAVEIRRLSPRHQPLFDGGLVPIRTSLPLARRGRYTASRALVAQFHARLRWHGPGLAGAGARPPTTSSATSSHRARRASGAIPGQKPPGARSHRGSHLTPDTSAAAAGGQEAPGSMIGPPRAMGWPSEGLGPAGGLMVSQRLAGMAAVKKLVPVGDYLLGPHSGDVRLSSGRGCEVVPFDSRRNPQPPGRQATGSAAPTPTIRRGRGQSGARRTPLSTRYSGEYGQPPA